MTMAAVGEPVRRHFLDRGHPLRRREPAMGYAARLAAYNGVTLSRLLGHMRIDVQALGRGEATAVSALAGLRDLGSVQRDALSTYTPAHAPGDKVFTVAGNRLLPGSILTTSMRICPHCVADDLARFDGPMHSRPWCRLEWMLDHVRTCATHGIFLVDVEPENVLKAGLDFSQAIADRVLPSLDRLRSDASTAPGTAFGKWCVARLDGIRDPANWLDDGPLHAGIAFCEALGFSAFHGPEARTSTLTTQEMAVAAESGYGAAAQGPAAVRAVLDRIVEERSTKRKGSVGHERTYGRVHAVLRRTIGDPDFARFRDALREHAFANLPIPQGTAFLGIRLESRRVHNQRSAAFAAARTDAALFRLLGVDGNAGADGAPDKGPRVRIPVPEFDAILASAEGYLTAKDAAASAGLNVKQFDRLVERGLLPILPEAERRAGTNRRFLRSDVEALVARLFEVAVRVPGPSGRRMSVEAASVALTVGAADIFELVLRGRLAWVGCHGKRSRCDRLLVDADDVLATLQSSGSGDDLSMEQTLALLPGVREGELWGLAQAGLLECTTANGLANRKTSRRKFRRFGRAGVAAFAAEYATLGEVAAAMGLNPGIAMLGLTQAGVRTVDGLPGIQMRLFRRRDVATYLGGVADRRRTA